MAKIVNRQIIKNINLYGILFGSFNMKTITIDEVGV